MLESFLGREKHLEAPIHPDFKIKDVDGFWSWNYTNFGRYIKDSKPELKNYNRLSIIKVAFPFDDPALLDNCPYMCKIGKNATSNPDTSWFGIAYAYEDDEDELRNWAKRFPRSELFTNLDVDGQVRVQF